MRLMKSQKGQILSLDLLISLTAIIFGIGLILQAYELTAYDIKEASLWDEMVLTGQIASERLMTDTDFTCNLVIGDDFYVTNCLNSSATINKQALGIPDKYDCFVDGFPVTDCANPIPATANNVYTIKRKALVNPGGLTKVQLYECIYDQPNCIDYEKEVIVSLWRKQA